MDESDPTLLPGLHPILRRIYLARNIKSEQALDHSLATLPKPEQLLGMDAMVDHLVEAVEEKQRLLIVADYDTDGATSCAVGKLGLEMLGAQPVAYLVPDRFQYGYGLSAKIVRLAAEKHHPDTIITVDNGIASIEGVEAARALGIKVLITDHHLPGETLPEADAIVNPNQPGDDFPSKALAGVGVIFYVLLALRARLRESGWFERQGIAQPNLGNLLDLVALGTVADVVPLDALNRTLVAQGIQRIRAGRTRVGLLALLEIAKCNPHTVVAADFGFKVAPRLNAAGRLDDMSVGIECLLSEEQEMAQRFALELDQWNRKRREIEEGMKNQAFALLDQLKTPDATSAKSGVCLYDKNWHEGVVGIVASRIKDRLHRPVIAFAPASDNNHEIKGSARSIPGVHIRDVLSDIAAQHPDLIIQYGGHAMAAGVKLHINNHPPFAMAFDAAVKAHLDGVDLTNTLYSDGALDASTLTLDFAEQLSQGGPWGQNFPEPLFDGRFEVDQVRILSGKHLKFVLKLPATEQRIDAIAFFVEQPESWLGSRAVDIAYHLSVNEFRDQRSAQLLIESLTKCEE